MSGWTGLDLLRTRKPWCVRRAPVVLVALVGWLVGWLVGLKRLVPCVSFVVVVDSVSSCFVLVVDYNDHDNRFARTLA